MALIEIHCGPRPAASRRKRGVHRATAGVRASVIGARTGSSALVHRKAIARSEPLLVSAFASHPRSSASSRSSSSVRRGGDSSQQSGYLPILSHLCGQAGEACTCQRRAMLIRTRQHAILDEQALQFDLPSCRKVASCRARHQSRSDRELMEPSQACSSLKRGRACESDGIDREVHANGNLAILLEQLLYFIGV